MIFLGSDDKMLLGASEAWHKGELREACEELDYAECLYIVLYKTGLADAFDVIDIQEGKALRGQLSDHELWGAWKKYYASHVFVFPTEANSTERRAVKQDLTAKLKPLLVECNVD